MTTFDRRKEAYEAKFARDEELKFKALARRNRLLGVWAAEKMGLSGEEAAAYAQAVVGSDLSAPGEEDVFQKVKADLEAKGIVVSSDEIWRTMQILLSKAVGETDAAR